MNYDRKKVLIVEDNIQEQQEIYDAIFSIDDAVRSYFSSTIESALKITYEVVIDIFILDIELSEEGSGIVLAKRIRKIPQYFDTPIIFATTYGDKEMKVFREVRCQTFILKPLERKKIIEAYNIAVKSIDSHMRNEDYDYRIKKQNLTLTYKGLTHEYKLSEIVLFRAMGNYVLIVNYNLKKDSLNIATKKETLKNISKRLDEIGEENFIRCHKGYIVNLQYVSETNWINNCLKLKLDSNDKLNQAIWFGEPDKPLYIPIGNGYKANLQRGVM
jgi:two-component system LytT family response regulator